MPVDNVSWRSRIGIYNTFKYLTQGSSTLKDPLLSLKVLLLFINYIFATLIDYIPNSTLCFLTNLLKIIDVEILFLLYIKLLLYCCGDVEITPGLKQSSSKSIHLH